MKIESMNIELRDFLDVVEEISHGKYLDIAKTLAEHNFTQSRGTVLLDDGRYLIKTFWYEIDGINVKHPFPVFADIEKCYGIKGSFDWWLEYIPIKRADKMNSNNINGFVYVLHAKNTDLYKIGCTNDVNRRVKELEAMSPLELELIYTFETNEKFKLEAVLHDLFSEDRCHGEWFCLNEKQLFQLGISVSEQIYKNCI